MTTRARVGTWCLVAATVIAPSAACTGTGEPETRLRLVASAELDGIQPLLADLRRDTGVDVLLDLRSGLDTAPLPQAEGPYDAAWLTTGAYQQLRTQATGGSPSTATPTMLSPVVIGMRPQAAAALRKATAGVPLTWADVADAAASGALTLAMTDPQRSGSGLAALVGVATAAAGTGTALRAEDVTCDRLGGFFAGRRLTAPTFPALAEAFIARQAELDAIVGEESALLALNDAGRLREPLELVYPADGIVEADYPLLLLRPAARAAYETVTAWLKTPDVQRRLSERTLRRPLDPGVPRDPRLRRPTGMALYFPARLAVLDKLLADDAGPDLRARGQVFFVLDFSGSMRGRRISELRATFAGLSGADRTSSGKFFRFYRGERFTVVRFGGHVLGEREFTVSGAGDLDRLGRFVAADDFDDRTAIWSALDHAYAAAAKTGQARTSAVVLMTDGLSNAGISVEEFLRRRAAHPVRRAMPTYAIRYGEADAAQLDRVARTTGGRMVDAGSTSLLDAFKEIRGCH